MANEQRVRGNFVSGTLSGALTNIATSMSSAGLANLPAVTSTQHATIAIESEIVYVTAHTGGATTATILRGQEGTTAAAHSSGVAWVHGPVVSDFDSLLSYTPITTASTAVGPGDTATGLSTTVTIPYAGHRIRVSCLLNFQSTVANDTGYVRVVKDAVNQVFGVIGLPAANIQNALTFEWFDTPTAASHTYSLVAGRFSGSGNLTIVGGTANPQWLAVEDLGPAL